MKITDKRSSSTIKPMCYANFRADKEICLSCEWLEKCASDTGQAYNDAGAEK